MTNSKVFEELQWHKFHLGSHGFVTLVDIMGDDNAVVQAARISYNKSFADDKERFEDAAAKLFPGVQELSEDQIKQIKTKVEEDTEGLLRYLMRKRHTTPFEMAEVKLLIHCPMDVWRQWIRHRTASVNEYSTRYTTAIDEAAHTNSDEWRVQSTDNKQGSKGYLDSWPEGVKAVKYVHQLADRVEDRWMVVDAAGNKLADFLFEPTPGHYLSQREAQILKDCRSVYDERQKFGIANEQARKDLPLSTYTESYWKVDLHNLLHFLALRMDTHAQKEIREFAACIGEQIIAPLFPKVWRAFVDYRLEGMALSRMDIVAIQTSHYYTLHPEDWANYQGDLNTIFPGKRERQECIAKLVRMRIIPEGMFK
jgi:thymidylate synthase (FAD)